MNQNASGWRSSEFWAAILGAAIVTYLVDQGKYPADVGVPAILALLAGYGASRWNLKRRGQRQTNENNTKTTTPDTGSRNNC